jgi:uncharacterized NAD(P)/FAD-binding protein YdhS
VLALGNPPPATLGEVSPSCHAAFVRDPWAPEAMHRLSGARRVAILGSGLTAVDVALSVLATNPAAEVSAISRHGLLPRAHLPGPAPAPRPLALHAGCSLEQIVQTIAHAAAAAPEAWRTVVDGLRPIATELWQGLTPAESTAIPEIRGQAAALTRLLTGTSAQRERASAAICSKAASGFSGSGSPDSSA